MKADYQTKFEMGPPKYEAADADIFNSPSNIFPDPLEIVPLDRLYGDAEFRTTVEPEQKVLPKADTDSARRECTGNRGIYGRRGQLLMARFFERREIDAEN